MSLTTFQRMAMHQAVEIPEVRQLLDWAVAYVENYTGLQECPRDRMRPEERDALQLLHDLGLIAWKP